MRTIVGILGLVAIAVSPACSCDSNLRGHHGDGAVMGDGGVNGALTVTPGDVTLDLTTGGPPPSQAFTVTVTDTGQDVTSQVIFSLGDMSLGTMNGNTFVAGTAHGGSTTLVANLNGMTGQANIHVRVHGSFDTSDCAGCTFPGMGAPSCGGTDTQPTIVYPPDGVLLPPNMNVITVQFLPGTGNTQFELDFENAATDVKINAKCTPTTDPGSTTSNGGCRVDLTPAMWTFIADSNRGGDAVTITVRGTNGTCVAPGANSVGVLFAEEDVSGGIYYWKSTVSASGTGGQIWRKEFGDATPEEAITGGTLGGTCNGCHALSRDGIRMTINSDDDDSDDEYGDVTSGLVDVPSKMLVGNSQFGSYPSGPAGFQTFNSDHSYYLATTGDGSGSFGYLGTTTIQPNQFFLVDGSTGMLATPNAVTAAMSATQRVTMPDWSADDKNVVYVQPTQAGSPSWQADDDHVIGGSIWSMPYMGNGMFGAPVELVPSSGDNNYYPSYSPDGAFIIYDHVPMQPAPDFPNNDSFSNPKARVFVLSTKPGSVPIDAAQLNGMGDLSNSWPRWSPFIQTYKGSRLLWVTFSSTRDYGLLVRNSQSGFVQCYPPDSAEDPGGSHGQPFPANCKQPQIWMAAINLSKAEIMGATDPSFPAFWLPFQDITTHNHTAQWTTTVVSTPPPDGGTCLMAGEDCTKAPNNCCMGLVCTANGTCGIP